MAAACGHQATARVIRGDPGSANWMNPAERILRSVDRWQQSHKPAAFTFGVFKKYGDDNAGQLAASLTYTGFITLFPLLLVLTTILGLVAASHPSLRHSVDNAVAGQFPLIGKQLTGNVGALRKSSFIGLIVGLVLAIWGTSGLAQSAMFTMAQIWNIPGPQRPGYLQRLGRSGLFLLGLLIGVVATTGLASLSAVGQQNPGISVAAVALAVVVNIGMFIFAYRVLTPKGVPVRALVPGAIIAGLGWTVLQAAGALVIKHYLGSESVYHIFALVLALIAWIYLLVQIMLYSAELNVVLVRHLYPRSMLQPPLTEADRAALALQPLQNQRREEQQIQVTFADREDGEAAPDRTPQVPGDVSPPARRSRLKQWRQGSSTARQTEGQTSMNSNGADPSASAPDQPVGELVKQMSEQVSRLVREEMKLAQLELARKGKRAGVGIGMFGGSGLVALYGLACLIACGIIALAAVVAAWLAALIVGVVLLIVAGVVALVGKGQLGQATPPVPEKAIDNVKADVAEIKEGVHR